MLRKYPRAKSQEPRAESQGPRAWSQEPRAKSQEPRAKSQETRAKSQEPRAKRQREGRDIWMNKTQNKTRLCISASPQTFLPPLPAMASTDIDPPSSCPATIGSPSSPPTPVDHANNLSSLYPPPTFEQMMHAYNNGLYHIEDT